MILVDTSIWIGFLRGRVQLNAERITQLVTCGPIVQEVLQGLKRTSSAFAFRHAFLRLTRLSDPMPFDTYVKAADIYLQGRLRGYTIRSSIDCLIAAVAIEHDIVVWHADRDFDLIARFTPLRSISSSNQGTM